MHRQIVSVAILCCLAIGTPVSAQVREAAKPDKYDVQLRYRIRAARDQRIVQFDALARHLKGLGFIHSDEAAFQLDLLDPAAERAQGSMPVKNLTHLFDDANILTAVLAPVGTAFDDAKKFLDVSIELTKGLQLTEQRLLHQQTTDQLAKLGFIPVFGYDHHTYTRLRGRMPATQVPLLVKDLRALPQGWFVGEAERETQPLPFRNVLAVRTVEVLPQVPVTTLKANAADSGKLTADLAAFLADPAVAEKPLVVEAVLDFDTSTSPIVSRRKLAADLPGTSIEGLAGSVVTVRLPKAKLLNTIATVDSIRHLRLPRLGSETAILTAQATPTDFVASSNLTALHALGYTGEGQRIVILATEFGGLTVKPATDKPGEESQSLTLNGNTLPTGSRFVDLTAEVNPQIQPAPRDATRLGGAGAAVAAHTAAPQAALLLVRVDPSRLYQILSVAKVVSGEEVSSPALDTRNEELTVKTSVLDSQGRAVNDEVRKAFSDLNDDDKQKKRRDDAAAALKKYRTDAAEQNAAVQRFVTLREGFAALRGATVVINTLSWDEGYPLDGQSELAKLIDLKFAVGGTPSAIRAQKTGPTPTWIQASSQAVGSVWAGPFLDTDANGVMEFSTADVAIPARRWTRELNFLQYRATDGKVTSTLPAGLKVRVAVQWREPHNPEIALLYEPMFEVRLRLFQQIDPSGKALNSDELVEVARSAGSPVRLQRTSGSGVYEQTVELTVPSEGAYALRVEGGAITANIPRSARTNAEIRPRLLAEATDPIQATKGRVQFETYATLRSGVGVPGDAIAAVAVGQTKNGEAAVQANLVGNGPGVELGVKPEVLADGAIQVDGKTVVGTGVSAGYVGGLGACLASANVRASDLIRTVGLQPGEPLVLPSEWLRSISPRSQRQDR